ncbi:MAG: Glutamate-1-semialdehyde 2,1-aminomutase [Planctomycetes bacterium]|nr:Glutamate-1-semialdehyde 2,1-aminomutase [Planctomycetota bacterium]
MARTSRNARLFAAASKVLPGGVSSPVRAFKSVGGDPFTIRSGRGARVTDADGREYADFVCAWGAQIVGHADPRVVRRIQRRTARGTVFGAPAVEETQLARRILAALPGAERVRFVSTGTEAVMSALRLARAATGREYIVKCSGNYHGHSDALLSSAGSGALTLGVPDSPGVPALWAAMTFTATTNDVEGMRQLFAERGALVAAVIVEPVVGNAGLIPPDEGWLAALREITREHGALLVLDEVMTGFRVAWGGAQRRYGVAPDLTCLAKVIGGGMPVGAYCGRAELMDMIAPAGPVYQAGTLSGNPVSMAGGIATLDILKDPSCYARLEETGAAVQRTLEESARRAGVPVRVQRVGSMLTVFFADPATPLRNLGDIQATGTKQFALWHRTMLANGVSWPPSNYEAAFLTLAHGDRELADLRRASDAAFAAVAAASA